MSLRKAVNSYKHVSSKLSSNVVTFYVFINEIDTSRRDRRVAQTIYGCTRLFDSGFYRRFTIQTFYKALRFEFLINWMLFRHASISPSNNMKHCFDAQKWTRNRRHKQNVGVLRLYHSSVIAFGHCYTITTVVKHCYTETAIDTLFSYGTALSPLNASN